jgi:hypothetical protein
MWFQDTHTASNGNTNTYGNTNANTNNNANNNNAARISRAGIIRGRISCVNLQGRGFKGYFIKKPIIETVFTIDCVFGLAAHLQPSYIDTVGAASSSSSSSSGVYRWESHRSLPEFKAFYDGIMSRSASSGSRTLIAPFPSAITNSQGDDDDIMVLVERKEMIDTLLKEILGKIDYAYYPPLKEFLRADVYLGVLERKFKCIQRKFRRHLSRSKFNQVRECVSASGYLLCLTNPFLYLSIYRRYLGFIAGK